MAFEWRKQAGRDRDLEPAEIPPRILLSKKRLPSHLVEIGALEAWEAGYRGGGSAVDAWVAVAVVDSGIDTRETYARRHLNRLGGPDYAHYPEWDDDPRTYVPNRVAGGRGWVDTKEHFPFIDEYGHGTKLACIIGARPGFDGVVGLVPRVQLYNYRVVDRDGKAYPEALDEAVSELVEDLAETRVRVALFALDLPAWADAAVTRRALETLAEAGVVAVIGAGDTAPHGVDLDQFVGQAEAAGEVAQPAHPAAMAQHMGLKHATFLVVSAHDQGETGEYRLTPTSNFGRTTVHLAAPGRGVLSASPMAPIPVYGTSAAAALVAGAAALIAGREKTWSPSKAVKVCRTIERLCRPPIPLRPPFDKRTPGGTHDAGPDVANNTIFQGILDLRGLP